MAIYQQGTSVFVPASRLDLAHPPYAVVERKVLANVNRSVRVDTEAGGVTTVASSVVFARIGILLLRIGDYASEAGLLDPLYKSMLHYFRLLVGPELVGCEIRTLDEFKYMWQKEHATKRYLVLVGHGKPDGILFGSAGWTSSTDVAAILDQQNTEVSILSMACQTGCQAFSQTLSQGNCVREVIAPHSSVPGAVASQFVQTYFAERLLVGRTEKSTFQQARRRAPGASNFRRWKDGRLDQ